MDFGEIEKYLPQYLSGNDSESLFRELKGFPENIDQRIFSTYSHLEPTIYQGDGLLEVPCIKPPETTYNNAPSIVLSNTCDIDKNNERVLPGRILYAPIINLSKYRSLVATLKDNDYLAQHIDTIRKQRISNIFYLPETGTEQSNESIVFLDMVCSYPTSELDYEDLIKNRLFTLSNYGFYLFLFKISIHFTRVQEAVNRG